jgi:molybdate transport system permease protein
VETLDYGAAHWLAGGLMVASFLMLLTVYALNRRFRTVNT